MRNKMSYPDSNLPYTEARRMSATYNDVVFSYIRREFAPLRHAAELLARAAGATPRTAKAWLAGDHAPNGENLMTLMASCEDLHTEISRLVAERRAACGEK